MAGVVPDELAKRRTRTFRELPIVDVSGLESPGSGAERDTVLALRQAAEEVGFLYVVGHGVPKDVTRDVERAARAFFGLPGEVKGRYHIGNSPNHRGYVPPGEEVFYGQTNDVKEAFDLSRELPEADYGAASRLLGPNVWPLELPELRAAAEAYYHAVFDLGRRLLRGFALALSLPGDHFDGHLSRPPSMLRLIHYPPTPASPGAMGIGSHTDYECFTILHATGPGLEVMNTASEWVAAPPLPGAFVINIGDLMQVWTNGLFVSTPHRVVATEQDRYSFPLFFTVDYDTVVEPLEHLCQGGKRYGALRSGEHLLAQVMQSFRYFDALRARGVVNLPSGAHEPASFGRERPESQTHAKQG